MWQRNRAIRRADAVICISENTKRDLMKFIPDVNPQKIHVIYNGVSQDYQVTSDKVSKFEDYLLFVGGRNAFKNGRFFVDSIKDTHYKVVFCGKPLTQEEETLFNEKLGNDRYKVLTGISNYELNRLYNSVKCLVYPSSYEGFGIPIIEAQSAGCPVIAMNTSSIPEVIGDTPLMMQKLTKEELLSKLKMLDNPDIKENVIRQGLQNAKRFSWDKTYNEYKKLYMELINQKRNNA
jgi:mannosyltransferase